MKSIKILPLVFVATLAFGAPADDEQHAHGSGNPDQLGQVHFPVSCNAAAQKQFERAVAMLHSFWYEEAAKEFAAIIAADPGCAMGYWGVAMSHWYPLWYPPDAAHFEIGKAAVEKAKSIGTKTERERDYIAAIETFYTDARKLDYPARVRAYEKAMEQLQLHYPDDREAGAFYALSLLATAPPTDKTYANQKKAGEILERLYTEQANHPGAAHYIIHSFDSPALASLALPAARNYAKIAPSVPHALHMPSHIFTRLGLWEESIQSNRASAAAAKDYEMKSHMDGAWDQHLHALDYLEYAYLQQGRDFEAKLVVEEISAVQKAMPENLTAAYALASIPARYAIERGHWSEARSLEPHPIDFPWHRFPWPEATVHFARALGATRSGDTAGAQRDLEKLESLHNDLVQAKEAYWADQVEILRREAAAWLAHAKGKDEDSLALMHSAAELEDSTDKHPATPGSIVPARELLGDLLLELHNPAQALGEFEASLRASPNRLNGLYGAARAAELAGDRKKAAEFFGKLAALLDHADGDLAELKDAKAFLANK